MSKVIIDASSMSELLEQVLLRDWFGRWWSRDGKFYIEIGPNPNAFDIYIEQEIKHDPKQS